MEYKIIYDFGEYKYEYLVEYPRVWKAIAVIAAEEFFGRDKMCDKYFCEQVKDLIAATASEECLVERYEEELKEFFEEAARHEFKETR